MPLPDSSVTIDRSLLRDDVYRRLRDGIVEPRDEVVARAQQHIWSKP